MMTGIFEPSSGNAWVGGNSIKDRIDLVQELIGYCPQFDLLWSDLSVIEHLYFYSRLKNVDSTIACDLVTQTLENIKLTKYKNFLVRELSGGMKRRLSLGISLVGNPSIVFLDEPTTGLDPDNKRQIWDILSNCKENKCMILTTHLMEEAEVLSDRIGIIVNGQLKCLGSQFKLKRVYGRGFKLVVNVTPHIMRETRDNNDLSDTKDVQGDVQNDLETQEEKAENVIHFIKDLFPTSQNTENFKQTLIFEIPNEDFDAELLFNEIQKNKEILCISNFALAQVSLEDIFIKLTESEIYT
jgi:ABC-type multidrug transport system ATPase subunit